MVIITVTMIIKEGEARMRKPRKRSFAELVLENKRQILKDQVAMDKIEERLEKKRLNRAE